MRAPSPLHISPSASRVPSRAQAVPGLHSMALVALIVCLLWTGHEGSSSFAQPVAGPLPAAQRTSISDPSKPFAAKPCTAAGEAKIVIRCAYTATPRPSSESHVDPRIVLNRAELSFSADEESWMVVDLTFTNDGPLRPSSNLTAYLAIDDEQGSNYLRRPLPAIALHRLAAGHRGSFSDRLLAPALRPGNYILHLWIFDKAPSDPESHTLLLSSSGVSDLKSGVNTLATLEVRGGVYHTELPGGAHDN